mmetsp:Transcript_5325/g.18831  ORF Transcript_5325/g.18831 Transcript_5325/m.18831 type:complete len:187 (-) Transcript_5325:29-589(-)
MERALALVAAMQTPPPSVCDKTRADEAVAVDERGGSKFVALCSPQAPSPLAPRRMQFSPPTRAESPPAWSSSGTESEQELLESGMMGGWTDDLVDRIIEVRSSKEPRRRREEDEEEEGEDQSIQLSNPRVVSLQIDESTSFPGCYHDVSSSSASPLEAARASLRQVRLQASESMRLYRDILQRANI